jgi:hypothetical protein
VHLKISSLTMSTMVTCSLNNNEQLVCNSHSEEQSTSDDSDPEAAHDTNVPTNQV